MAAPLRLCAFAPLRAMGFLYSGGGFRKGAKAQRPLWLATGFLPIAVRCCLREHFQLLIGETNVYS
jgi:hypothetical protein